VGGELGVDPSKDGVDEVLERVGLLAYSDTKIAKLSKGMVQRLSIAQALMGNPQTLVLDEPLIGVDPIGADHLRKMLADFASKGGSVILSSHQLPEVEGLCTSVTAFRRGGVMFSGRVSELVGRVLGELTVRVEAIGLERNVIDKIRTLDGVLEVEENPRGLRVRVKADRELRPIIARTLIEEGCELREIGYLNNTLEELYRRVVGGDASGEG
jgi:ABC-type multidrug transport system, ATPase component